MQFELKYCSNSQQSATIVNGSITFSTRLSWSSTCSALPIASSVQMSPSMSFRDKTVSYVHFDTIGLTLINLQINYRSQGQLGRREATILVEDKGNSKETRSESQYLIGNWENSLMKAPVPIV